MMSTSGSTGRYSSGSLPSILMMSVLVRVK
jgi:hypothetical protein